MRAGRVSEGKCSCCRKQSGQEKTTSIAGFRATTPPYLRITRKSSEMIYSARKGPDTPRTVENLLWKEDANVLPPPMGSPPTRSTFTKDLRICPPGSP